MSNDNSLLQQMDDSFNKGPSIVKSETEPIDTESSEMREVRVLDILNQHTFDDGHALDVYLLTKVTSYTVKDFECMDYIDDIAPLLSQMEDQLTVRGKLEEDEDTRDFTLKLLHPITVGPISLKQITVKRPTLTNLSVPGSRNKGEVRRNVQVIRNLTGLTTTVIHEFAVVDYLTLVEQFQIWRER